MRVVDLTITLGDPRVAVYKEFPSVSLEAIHRHEVHGRSNTRLSMPIHVGTHVDPPYHFYAEGLTIDQLPLDKVMGMTVRLDLRSVCGPLHPINRSDLESAASRVERKLRGCIVITHSGWAERALFEPSFYTDNPFLAADGTDWLIAQGIKALALDHPIDKPGGPGVKAHPGDCPNHRAFLGAGVPLIENVINLETFSEDVFRIVALPMKIYRCDGGPARVIAILGNEPFLEMER